MIPEINPRRASIETCTACNHACQYCPAAEFPKKQQVMSMDIFTRTMEELESLGTPIRRISLSHYNETLLDPHFVDRVRVAAPLEFIDYISIFSNLSLLRESHIKELEFARKRVVFDVNLPTVDRERYRNIHGIDHYPIVEANLHRLIDAGYQVRINAQKNAFITEEDSDGVVRLFGDKTKVSIRQSDDRGGLVPGFVSVRHEGRITGCSTRRVLDFLHVAVDGGVFLCCQDYFTRYRLGDLNDQSLRQILVSDKAKEYLGYIYGEACPPDDFICRTCEFAICEDVQQ